MYYFEIGSVFDLETKAITIYFKGIKRKPLNMLTWVKRKRKGKIKLLKVYLIFLVHGIG